MRHLISLDVGTSSVRALLYNQDLDLINVAQREIKITSPNAGWVEQDPLELFEKSKEVLEEIVILAKDRNLEIAGLGITNQRETTILWSKKTGLPIYPAIVWQDRRTAKFCESLTKKGLNKKIYQKTGLRIDPYFSASKINWILKNVSQTKKPLKENDLLFGTVDSWIIWNLTSKQKHVTDVTNASRTMLFNINSLEWDSGLTKIFNIPKNILPVVFPSASIKNNFGIIKILDIEIPIISVCGDQTAALFGQECFKKGETKVTYGTGGFVVVNAGENPILKNSKLITTIAWQIDNKIVYALEGSIFQSGGALKWLRDNLQLFKDYDEADNLASEVKEENDLYLVPAFVGLGAPYWNPSAQGLIVGLTNQTKRQHLIKAAIESAAYQVNDILEVIAKDYFLKIKSIKVDGGLTLNNYLVQFQSDIARVLVENPNNKEMTGLGVARMAAKILSWNIKTKEAEKIYKPNLNIQQRNKLVIGWKKSIKITINN